MSRYHITKYLPGFSLIEVAIVLCIIGVISGLGFPFLNHYVKQKKALVTEDHLSTIIHSLSAFIMTHKRLPCPADPKASVSEKGTEQESCHFKKSFIGIVPYRSLGIPEKMAQDGYNNWISYSVNLDLTSPELKHLNALDETILPNTVFCEIKKGANELSIQNADGLSVLDSTYDVIAVVLISHGPSGQGSFDFQGNKRLPTGPSKIINADSTLTFIDRPLSLTKDDFFDDIVKWVTRDNLMAFYGKAPCNRRNFD